MQGPNVDEGRLVGDLAPQAQAALWRHLDEIGYFIDENKRTQILGRRLADLAASSMNRWCATSPGTWILRWATDRLQS